jgi:ribosome biogenesis GTPase
VTSPLARLGWDEHWEAAAAAVAEPALQAVRIAAEHRGAYHAIGPSGTDAVGVAWVELPGKAFHDAVDKRALPTVGDWVLVERWPEALAAAGAGVVRHVLPRRSFLVRRAAGEATAPQPLAANVDVGIVMTSANTDLSPARLDRYLGLLRDGGIEPVIVVSKIDLATDVDSLLVAAAAVGARAVGVSVVTDAGLDEIRALAGAGRTTVLLGSSGVCKSSLLNALIGTTQETREIRADERGRHTTTRRELFAIPGGGLVVDTPGMRELKVWHAGTEEAEDAFEDVFGIAAECKYRDCRHANEPGCSVREAVAKGTLDAARLASFHKLEAERARKSSRKKRG